MVTSVWLMVGHLGGGLALGGLLAGVGTMIRFWVGTPGEAGATVLIGVVVLLAALFDMAGKRLPGRRQVDERWLTTYRGWVYGGGFGLQLGFGLVTVVNTALVAGVLVAGVVVPAVDALVLGVAYGAVRGVAATATGWVRSVGDLRRLHRWLDVSERPARWVAASIGAVSAVAAAMIA
jgi:hypothetical protein